MRRKRRWSLAYGHGSAAGEEEESTGAEGEEGITGENP
jgi:hypothetical protein